MNIEDAVQQGSDIFADAESAAMGIVTSFRALRPIFETVRDAGPQENGKYLGSITCARLASRADALATNFLADIFALHDQIVELAKEIGIEDLIPEQRDGGGHR